MANRRPKPRRRRKPSSAEFDQELVQMAEQGRFGDVVSVCERQMRVGSLSTLGGHVYGVGLIRMGRFDTAIETLEDVALKSDAENKQTQSLAIRNDLAKAYFAAKRFRNSIDVLSRLVNENPDETSLVHDLLFVMEESGHIDEAIARCQEASRRWSSDAKIASKLGDLMMLKEDWQSAADAYARTLEVEPSDQHAIQKSVITFRRMDDQASVAAMMRHWLKHDPGNAIAEHLLAATESGEEGAASTPARASEDYVREVFNQFAESFDEQLADLGYAAPRLMASLLDRLGLKRDQCLRVLDAGCGTGLMGEHLRPFASYLLGVDLSPAMLEQAGAREYDKLVCADLVTFLSECHEEYDLIVAADTLNYFGDLTTVFESVFSKLASSHGMLIFSLEQKQSSHTSDADYQLETSGRFSHDLRYVREALQQCGFSDLLVTEGLLRNEANKEVTGLYWTARKSYPC